MRKSAYLARELVHCLQEAKQLLVPVALPEVDPIVRTTNRPG